MSQNHESLKTKDEDQTDLRDETNGSEAQARGRERARHERSLRNRELHQQKQALRDAKAKAEREERRRLNRLEHLQRRASSHTQRDRVQAAQQRLRSMWRSGYSSSQSLKNAEEM